MMTNTREQDIGLFMEIAREEDVETPQDVPFSVLVPAFITSELKSAFAIGFLIYIPFVVIDLVVASVLMSMGMMMLSPMMISMPFKLMLFVLVDGWGKFIMGSLTSSFALPYILQDTAQVIDLARDALWVTVLVSAPTLLFALAVGVVIGVIQAATLVNEMTLSFIPKLAALALSLAFFWGG